LVSYILEIASKFFCKIFGPLDSNLVVTAFFKEAKENKLLCLDSAPKITVLTIFLPINSKAISVAGVV
jgi:hypothetical protein